jgi:hypothetical protein
VILADETKEAWSKLSVLQQDVIQQLIISMVREPNCSPFRAINTALAFMWPNWNPKTVSLGVILKALRVFNSRNSTKGT